MTNPFPLLDFVIIMSLFFLMFHKTQWWLIIRGEGFPEPKFVGKVRIELDLFNYATKTDLKIATGIDISSFAEKVDLASLESNLGKLDISKLKNVPTNLNK